MEQQNAHYGGVNYRDSLRARLRGDYVGCPAGVSREIALDVSDFARTGSFLARFAKD